MEIKRNPSITSLRDPEKSVSSKSVKRLSKKVDQSQPFFTEKKAKGKKLLSISTTTNHRKSTSKPFQE